MPLFSLSVAQLILAVVSASILLKLNFSSFFLKWLASHRFTCYLVPGNADLKKLIDKPKKRNKGQSRQKVRSRKVTHNVQDNKEIFKIPAVELDYLELAKTTIRVGDFELINYSQDLEWIMDLALVSIFSFFLIELQFYFVPQTKECNLSPLWALLVILYCLKSLWKLTAIYFLNEESIGERSICIISGCMFLLIAMVILIIDEKHLELGLESAYISFNKSATAFVNNHTLLLDQERPTTKPVSFILVKFSIALISSLTGVIFTFPGLRFGQLHRGIITESETTTSKQLLYNINYLAPLIIVCLWIKPIARDVITSQDVLPIDDAIFETLRIYLVIIFNLLRFILLPHYIAVFLRSAKNRVARLKYRGGTTTNREIQLTVSSIYNYVNVITIQYVTPILLCVFTTILLKTLGGHYWIPSTTDQLKPIAANETVIHLALQNDSLINNGSNVIFSESLSNDTSSVSGKLLSTSIMVSLIEFKKIFSSDVFQGLLGFATWWLHFAWFCTSTTGMIYHTYFTH